MNSRRIVSAIFTAAMAVTVFLTFPAVLYAEEISTNEVRVVLNGQEVDFEDTNAQIIHDYTYVPIAKIIELLTKTRPIWDDSTKSSSFAYNGQIYRIFIDQFGVYVDNVFKEFSEKPEIVDDRTLIPLRMLTNALGFGQEWDGVTRTVTLTTPDYVLNPPAVKSVDPVSHVITAGSQVSITVTTSIDATEARIVDSNNNPVIGSKIYNASAISNSFTLSFTPTEAGRYRVYAVSPAGYSINSSVDIFVSFGTPAALHSVSVSNGTTGINGIVNVTVNAGADTSRVKLVSDMNPNDIIESSSYATNGELRVFTLGWPIKSSFYQNLSTVTAKVYAGSDSGYSAGYKPVSVNVTASQPIVFSAVPSNSRPIFGSNVTVYMLTDTNTEKVWLYNSEKGDFLETSSYSESNGRRAWTISYKIDLYDYQLFTAYAADADGNTKGSDFSLDINSEPATIYEVRAMPQEIQAGSQTGIYVTTGANVTRVDFNISNGQGSLRSASETRFSEADGRRYWQNSFYSGDQLGATQISVTAVTNTGASAGSSTTVYTKSGNNSDANITDVYPGFYDAVPGEMVEYVVSTGLDAVSVSVALNGKNLGNAYSTGNDGSYQYWSFIVTAPLQEGTHRLDFTSTGRGGRGDGSNDYVFLAVYYYDIDPTDN